MKTFLAFVATFIAAACAVSSVQAQTTGAARYTILPIADNTGPLASFSAAYPAINANGTVTFRATLKAGGEGLYTGNGGSLATVVRTTDGVITGFNGRGLGINDKGVVAFTANTVAGSKAVYVAAPGAKPVKLVDSATDERFTDSLIDPAINEAGTVAFPAVGGGQGGYYSVSSNGQITELYLGGNNVNLDPCSLNDAGQLAAVVTSGSGAQRVIRAGPGADAVSTIVETGSQFNSFSDSRGNTLDIDAGGRVLFHAALTGGGGGLYIATSASLIPVAQTAGSPYSLFTSAVYGRSGGIIFGGDLRSGGGGAFDGSAGADSQIIPNPLLGSNLTAFGGVARGVANASGQVAFTYELANGRKGVAVAIPIVKPVVSVAADVRKVSRASGAAATVTFTRAGSTAGKLKLVYTVTGSADNGVDYALVSGRAKIKADRDTATIKIAPLASGSNGKVVVTLVPSAKYDAGETVKAKIKIVK